MNLALAAATSLLDSRVRLAPRLRRVEVDPSAPRALSRLQLRAAERETDRVGSRRAGEHRPRAVDRIAVSDQGHATITLVCPATPTGCDASGVLTIHLPANLLERAADATTSGATGTVPASFSDQQIAGGRSALIAVQLDASFLRQPQTLRIRRVKGHVDRF